MKQTELADSWSVVEVEAVKATAPRIDIIYKISALISAISLTVIVYASYSVI